MKNVFMYLLSIPLSAPSSRKEWNIIGQLVDPNKKMKKKNYWIGLL